MWGGGGGELGALVFLRQGCAAVSAKMGLRNGMTRAKSGPSELRSTKTENCLQNGQYPLDIGKWGNLSGPTIRTQTGGQWP